MYSGLAVNGRESTQFKKQTAKWYLFTLKCELPVYTQLEEAQSVMHNNYIIFRTCHTQ